MVAEKRSQSHGIMVIWHGVADRFEADYLNWHTSEHMPERIAIPGFIRGRRSCAHDSKLHPYITLYEADDVGVFGSPAYFDRLNTPTAWSQKSHPNIINFIRGACEVIASRGVGVGRSTLAIRIGLDKVQPSELQQAAELLCDSTMALPFVTSVKFGVARHDVSGAKTKETELRGTAGDRFDGVLLIDSHSEQLIRQQAGEVVKAAQATGLTVGANDYAVYDLHYVIDAREPQGCEAIAREMS